MSEADASWRCLQKLFSIFDKDKDGKLNLDDLVLYVAEVRKMGIIDLDEANVVNEMMKLDAEYITFEDFKMWSSVASKNEENSDVFVDPFGNSNVLPERFRDANAFSHKAKSQHPCYTTTSHEVGGKAPRVADMPNKWRGRQGEFTDEFIVNEPGKGLQINTYLDRGLKTSKTTSKVHRLLDNEW